MEWLKKHWLHILAIIPVLIVALVALCILWKGLLIIMGIALGILVLVGLYIYGINGLYS